MTGFAGRPTCDVGGYRNDANGCPADYPSGSKNATKLSTGCFAVSKNASAAVGSDFHCFLSCDRAASPGSPDHDADAACPGDATCRPGVSRLRHVGVCGYD